MQQLLICTKLVNAIFLMQARILADVPGLRSTPPSCWCVLPTTRTSRILAANNKDIFLLDLGGQCHQQYPSGKKKVTVECSCRQFFDKPEVPVKNEYKDVI